MVTEDGATLVASTPQMHQVDQIRLADLDLDRFRYGPTDGLIDARDGWLATSERTGITLYRQGSRNPVAAVVTNSQSTALAVGTGRLYAVDRDGGGTLRVIRLPGATDGANPTSPFGALGEFHAVAPVRLADTRQSGALNSQAFPDRTFPIWNSDEGHGYGGTDTVAAVLVNITAINGGNDAYLKVFGTRTSPAPFVSTLNLRRGETAPTSPSSP